MIADSQSALIRWFFTASLLLLLVQVTIELIEHPKVVTTAGTQGVAYLILFLLVMLIYGWFALFRSKAATPAERIALQQGVLWGAVLWERMGDRVARRECNEPPMGTVLSRHLLRVSFDCLSPAGIS